MKLTKFVHSCVLLEIDSPVPRTVLFDPGAMSQAALDVEALTKLDDIVITHVHADHFHLPLVKQLALKFPEVRITSTPEVVEQLKAEGITATTEATQPLTLFDAPHESVAPIFEQPQATGVHYADLFTDPGDCHNFAQTMPVLALPMTGPWGSMIRAVNLALELKPQYILPIHDWHWNDQARASAYEMLEGYFKQQDIVFLKPETGVLLTINL